MNEPGVIIRNVSFYGDRDVRLPAPITVKDSLVTVQNCSILTGGDARLWDQFVRARDWFRGLRSAVTWPWRMLRSVVS